MRKTKQLKGQLELELKFEKLDENEFKKTKKYKRNGKTIDKCKKRS